MPRVVSNFTNRLSKRLSRQGLYEFLECEYASIEAGQDVLTVGAGGRINALLGRYARDRGFRVISLDIDPVRGPDVVGDLCAHDFGEMRFDVVVLGEVLEHVHSPHRALENVFNVLRGEGRLILTTPFIFPIHDRPVDYYRYTRYGLEFLLRDFRDVRVRERNSWSEAINVLPARLWRERPGHPATLLLVLVAYASWPLMRLLGRLIASDLMTTGYVVTARKPRTHSGETAVDVR